MIDPILAVDFGTTASSAAVVTGDRVRLVREPASSTWFWPSAVFLSGATLLVGTPAEQRKRADPLAYRAEFKRALGDPTPIQLGAKCYQPEDLVTELLAAIREQAQRLAGGPLDHAVLTVPAGYRRTDPRRELVIAAAEQAGFTDVELLPEPVAAALAPVEGAPFGDGDLVLVYDFGGGTFDAALVRHGHGGGFEVVGQDFAEDCGGRDVDERLGDHIRALGGDRLDRLLAVDEAADEPGRAAAMRVAIELGDFARQAKHQLTDSPSADDFFTHAMLAVSLERGELTAMAAPLITRTVDCCRRMLAGTGTEPSSVTAVLLVGGSSRIPAVHDLVGRDLGRPLRFAEDPALAVVEGAARWAGRSSERAIPAWPAEDGHRPLRWQVPGGEATVLRWLVERGAGFAADQALLVVRSAEGTLLRLTPGGRPGRLVDQHLGAGSRFLSGDWLATVGPAADETPAVRVVERPTVLRHPGVVTAVEFSPDGRWLAGAAGRTVTLWPIGGESEGEPRAIDFAERVCGVRFSPDCHRIAVGHDAGAVVYDLRQDRFVMWTGPRHGAVRRVAVDRAGSRIVALAPGDRYVIVRNAATGTELVSLRPPSGAVTAVEFDPVLSRVVTCGTDATVRFWEAATGEELNGQKFALGVVGRDLAYCPSGAWLACALGDGTVRILDLRNRVVRPLIGASGVEVVAAGPDRIATSGGTVAQVWDAPTGAEMYRIDHERPVHALALHPAGLLVATAGGDTHVTLTVLPAPRTEDRSR